MLSLRFLKYFQIKSGRKTGPQKSFLCGPLISYTYIVNLLPDKHTEEQVPFLYEEGKDENFPAVHDKIPGQPAHPGPESALPEYLPGTVCFPRGFSRGYSVILSCHNVISRK